MFVCFIIRHGINMNLRQIIGLNTQRGDVYACKTGEIYADAAFCAGNSRICGGSG